MTQSNDNHGIGLDVNEFDSFLRNLSERDLFDQMDLFGLSRIEQVWLEIRRRMLGVD